MRKDISLKGKYKAVTIAATAAILATAGLLLLPSTTRSDSVLTLDPITSTTDAAEFMTYECVKDHMQCLRGIPSSSIWTTAAYEIELGSCCVVLNYCTNVVSHLHNRVLTDTDAIKIYKDAACPVAETEEPAPEHRRQSLLDSLQIQQEANN